MTNAAIEVGGPTAVKTLSLQNKCYIYPNPAKDEFYIKLDIPLKQDWVINVINPLGQMVYFAHLDKQTSKTVVPANQWPSGIYLVMLKYGELSVFKKIMLE